MCRHSRRGGVTVLETIVALPVLFIALLAIVELGQLSSGQMIVQNASRAGADMAVTLACDLVDAATVPVEIIDAVTAVLECEGMAATCIRLEHTLGTDSPTVLLVGLGGEPPDATPPSTSDYVCVSVCVENTELAPNLLRSFCLDLANTFSQKSTCRCARCEDSEPPPEFLKGSESLQMAGSSGASEVEGTIGDADASTDYTVTTDSGAIVSTNPTTGIMIREGTTNGGTFTIDFDDPVANFEFWVSDFTNSSAFDAENLLGNFTVTLSDGTVLNNAAFTIVGDAIAPNTNVGQFFTSSRSRELVSQVTRGGANYLTDPTVNSSNFQSAGRIRFDAVPFCPPGTHAEEPVGIQSFSFERSGGPNGFIMFFNFSGSVVQQQ